MVQEIRRNGELASLMENSLDKHSSFISGKTYSMYPVIKPNSSLKISRKKTIKVGNIVAYLRENNIIVHRVVYIKTGKFLIKGDRNYVFDGYVEENDIIGVIERIDGLDIRKAGKNISSRIIAFFSLLEGLMFSKINRKKQEIYRKTLSEKKLAPEQTSLISSLTGKRLISPSPDLPRFIGLIRKFKVGGLVYNKLKNNEINKILREDYGINFIRNELILKETKRLAKIFKSSGIPFVLLKGIHILKKYNDIGERYLSDIDILVPKKYIRAAEKTLYKMGYNYYSKIHSKFYQDIFGFHYQFVKKNDFPFLVEIHWDSVPNYTRLKIPLAELWKNDSSIYVGDEAIRVLNDRMLLIYLSYSFSYPNFFHNSISYFYDVAVLAKNMSAGDWGFILDFAKKHRLNFQLYYTLFYSKKIFDSVIPKNILDKLRDGMSFMEMVTVYIFDDRFLFKPRNESFFEKIIMSIYFRFLSHAKVPAPII